MIALAKGSMIEEIADKGEGTFFMVDDSGYTLVYNFRNPTAIEIEQVAEGKPFEIRFAELGGLLFITSKCGNLNWTDAPYHSYISREVCKKLIRPNEGEGTALTLFMSDANTGIIKTNIRLIGLSTKFSLRLIDTLQKMADVPIDVLEYEQRQTAVYKAYKSSEIAKMSKDRFKIGV